MLISQTLQTHRFSAKFSAATYHQLGIAHFSLKSKTVLCSKAYVRIVTVKISGLPSEDQGPPTVPHFLPQARESDLRLFYVQVLEIFMALRHLNLVLTENTLRHKIVELLPSLHLSFRHECSLVFQPVQQILRFRKRQWRKPHSS